jgi:uncharacterized protein YbjQ (UPF0145 family)
MIMTTTDTVPGREIAETIGLVRGMTVRGAHLGHDVMAKLKNLVGGELTEYTKLTAEAREQALDRMCSEARARGADAVVCVRFCSTEVDNGAAEFMCYGTAVRLTWSPLPNEG